MNVFGTDGIRGKVGDHPMTVSFTSAFASAISAVLAPTGGKVIIGKDTRRSGYMFESSLESAFVASGLDVVLLGPLPSPAIAIYTKETDADFGIIISASHNSYEYNGIKIINSHGEKIDSQLENEIEKKLLDEPITKTSENIGKATRSADSRDMYESFLTSVFNHKKTLTNVKLVLDCSNGAAYKVAPSILSKLGAEIIPIACSPNGFNINKNCGSTNPENIMNTVKALKADLGIALDGDADRILLIDENGKCLNGDQILYMLAMINKDKPNFNSKVVGTILTNSGLESSLNDQNIRLYRSDVGDKNVLDMMKKTGSIIGGETSGHIINSEYSPTGDGLLTALLILKDMVENNRKTEDLLSGLSLLHQFNENINIEGRSISESLIHEINTKASKRLEKGRVIIRLSGTEPIIRVTIESNDQDHFNDIFNYIESELNSNE
ncbi:MAG: phosphoglucosamine mutase [Gammaproteobacteria bacterium]|nr:phosphoglucosamine mutase [Gammaproteobacteria bacterium]